MQLRALQRFPQWPETKLSSNSFLLHFPAFCKAGGKKILELIQIRCRQCGVYFCICRRCRKAYCDDDCKVKGYRKRHREAQKRYKATEKGKKNDVSWKRIVDGDAMRSVKTKKD